MLIMIMTKNRNYNNNNNKDNNYDKIMSKRKTELLIK